ncbi:MAG TPA: hypothetical protein DCZ94_10290 [Lentisphaeria bacterium]|nr:MAG: hypothetical protein A2X48_23820 [Lentisphaerae bacterium GWF2_49_21]HBC87333.1 hypothetical protein [Lentisphaeria bacterium]
MRNFKIIRIFVFLLLTLAGCEVSKNSSTQNLGVPFKDERTMVIKIDDKIIYNDKQIDRQNLYSTLSKNVKEYGLDAPIVLIAPFDMNFDAICKTLSVISSAGYYSVFFKIDNDCIIRVFFPSIPTEGINVTVINNNQYKLNNKIYSLPQLTEQLKILFRKDNFVHVSYEKSCNYQDFINLLKTSNDIGYNNLLYNRQDNE